MEKKTETIAKWAAISAAFAAFIRGVEACLSVFDIGSKNWPNWLQLVYAIILSIVLGFPLCVAVWQLCKIGKLQRWKTKERLSASTFKALQDANRNKTREVMRYTYGTLYEWDEINYYKNLLMYDIHEQIRYILISLRDLIINNDTKGNFNKDNVTVDLLYSYVDVKISDLNNQHTLKDNVRLISSGDNDCGGIISDLLQKTGYEDSFYRLLDEGTVPNTNPNTNTSPSGEGYIFLNDKNVGIGATGNRRYIPSIKDVIYSNIRDGGIRKTENDYNSEGSIVGLCFYLKNDEPHKVAIKAWLTITTYGKKIIDGKPGSDDVDSFVEDFYNKVLCSYKSLLISELAQIHIRHQVKQGIRNPTTGEYIRIENAETVEKELKKSKEKYREAIDSASKVVNSAFEENKKLFP